MHTQSQQKLIDNLFIRKVPRDNDRDNIQAIRNEATIYASVHPGYPYPWKFHDYPDIRMTSADGIQISGLLGVVNRIRHRKYDGQRMLMYLLVCLSSLLCYT